MKTSYDLEMKGILENNVLTARFKKILRFLNEIAYCDPHSGSRVSHASQAFRATPKRATS